MALPREIYLNISRDSTLFAAYPRRIGAFAKDSYLKLKSWTRKGLCV